LKFTKFNISLLQHLNGEEGTLIPIIGFILLVWVLNQGNPSILIVMDDARTGWTCFPSSRHVQPCATVCNAKYLAW
jgi:hypothetical protein